jgi:hypothetical protein
MTLLAVALVPTQCYTEPTTAGACMYKTQDGLTIIEGLEPVQRRPAMYIGAEEPGRSPSQRLLEGLVDAIANDTPPPWKFASDYGAGPQSPLPGTEPRYPSNPSTRAAEASRIRLSISCSCLWLLVPLHLAVSSSVLF